MESLGLSPEMNAFEHRACYGLAISGDDLALR
jgi:hypothetical protein